MDVYSNYQFHKVLGLRIRAEFLDNTDNVMYLSETDVGSFILNGCFSSDDDHFYIKPEFKIDS